MSNGKVMIIHLIAGLITKTLYKRRYIFPNHRSFWAETLELKLIRVKVIWKKMVLRII